MTEPNFSVDFTAEMIAASACSKGDCLVYDTAAGYWRVASDANRTTASATTQAIALTPYGGSLVGTVSYQASGVVAKSVSGLDALTPTNVKKLVRTSTAGRLERVDAYTAGDDIVGYATWDGRVSLHLGLPWSLIAALGGIAALPDYSVQYRKPDGTLGGAAHVSIDPTGGYIERGTAPFSTTGTGRNGAGAIETVRSNDNTRDVRIWRHTVGTAPADDIVYYGSALDGSRPTEAVVWSKYFAGIAVGVNGPVQQAALITIGPGRTGASGTGATARIAAACPNFYIGTQDRFNGLTADPVSGGIGIGYHEGQTTEPTGNPSGGFWWRSNSSTHRVEFKFPTGDALGDGWHDPFESTGGGWPPPYKLITAAEIDADGVVDTLVDGVPALTLIFDDSVSADVDVTGFTKPADGSAGEHKLIHSLNGEFNLRIVNNDTDADDAGVLTASGTDWVIDNAVGSYGIDYDWSRERWVPQRGAS